MKVTPENFSRIQSLLAKEVAITLNDDKHYLVNLRLKRLAQRYTDGRINALIEMAVDQDPSLKEKILEAMATNETSFFRDPVISFALPSLVIPKTLYKNRHEKTLRIWSAACSTGQEPYSVAMLLKEHLPSIDDWDIQIIASDISRENLAKAESACYSLEEVNRGLPAHRLARYFVQKDLRWQVADPIRNMVSFRRINLADSLPKDLPLFDIVLLRNVMIYFSASDKDHLLSRLHAVMRRDGHLLLGATEIIVRPERFGFSAAFNNECDNLYRAE